MMENGVKQKNAQFASTEAKHEMTHRAGAAFPPPEARPPGGLGVGRQTTLA
jgi:hypothetical protein